MNKIAELKTALNSYIFETLHTDEFKENLEIILKSEIIKAIVLKKDEFIKAEAYRDIKLKLKKDIIVATRQQNFREGINKFIDENLRSLEKSNKAIGSIIPSAFINSLKVYVYNHSEDIASTLKSLLNSENVIKKINTEVLNILNGINPMISRFINASTIQSKIISGINDYLNDSKNMMDLVTMVNSMLDTLMKKKISEFVAYFPAEGRKSLINSISAEVINNIFSDKLIDIMFSKFEGILEAQLSSLNENSEGLNREIGILVNSFMNSGYLVLLESDILKQLVELASSNIVNNILNKPIIDLIKGQE